MNGQTVQKPYLTFKEFRSVTVCGPDRHVPLRKLLTVSSLDEAIRLLGDPQSTERNGDPESFTTWLRYGEDTNIEYVGSTGGALKLTGIVLRSSEWGLKIEDKELAPGLNVARLDAAVRRSAVPEGRSTEGDMSGVRAIYIATPNAAKSQEVEPLSNGMTQFNSIVGGTGTVEVVRLSRIPSN